MKSQAGFTLLELLIALSIFALLGIATHRMLDGVLRAERGSAAHELRLRHLQRALGVLERDLVQVMARPRDQRNAQAGSGFSGNSGEVDLQRTGWNNPLDQPRSHLQRVRYYLEGGSLWRDFSAVDAPGSPASRRQALLERVEKLRLRYYQAERGWVEYWSATADGASRLPLAVEVTLALADYPEIRRVLLLPQDLPAPPSTPAKRESGS